MKTQPPRLYSFGPFSLDTRDCTLRRDTQPVMLEPKVLSLLLVLVERNPALVSKDELMELIWPDTFVGENSLSVCVSKLRKVLSDAPGESEFIRTVPRRGYRFAGHINEAQSHQNGRRTEASQGSDDSIAEYPTGYEEVKNGAIAVLPFRFLGGANDGFLGLGIADSLITRLGNLKRITVRPTSSVRKYDAVQDSAGAGRELGVESVLEGSIQRLGRRVRVTAQLVNVTDGSLMWAGTFDEKFTNIFALEDSIAEGVANALAPSLTQQERTLLAKRYTENAEAYEAYLRGRYFFGKRTREGLEKGIESFNRAITIDPSYALAYSGVADGYTFLRLYYALPLEETNLRTEQAALRAIEIDGNLAEAHASLGHLRIRQWDWSGAEKEFKLAIKLNPNYATAHNWFALYLQLVGRTVEAVLENKKALEKDPLSTVIQSTRGKLLYFSRQYDMAIEHLSRTLEWDPNYGCARYCLGLTYEAKGRYDEALVSFKQAMEFFADVPDLRACVARSYALSGRRSEALAAIDELTRSSSERYVQPYFVALIYAALEETDEAFSWLERGFVERDEALALLKVDPRMDGLRSNPRFEVLLGRIGLPNTTNRQTLLAAFGRSAFVKTHAE